MDKMVLTIINVIVLFFLYIITREFPLVIRVAIIIACALLYIPMLFFTDKRQLHKKSAEELKGMITIDQPMRMYAVLKELRRRGEDIKAFQPTVNLLLSDSSSAKRSFAELILKELYK